MCSGRRGNWWVTFPLACVLIWFIASGIFRYHGIVFVVLATAYVLVAGARYRRGERRWLFAGYFAFLSASLALVLLEATLRLCPALLGGQLANAAYSGYHRVAGGIYRPDRYLGYAFKPGFRADIYWNGYWWRHRTNRDGYRGRQLRRAEAVFLGDSMIYGHGVAERDTVACRFSARTGLSAANLGQQGISAIQALARFDQIGAPLRPRLVFVCCHPNDIDDVDAYYEPAAIAAFLRTEPSSAALPAARRKYWPRPWWDLDQLWDAYVQLPTRTSGVLIGLYLEAKDRLTGRCRRGRGRTVHLPAQRRVQAEFKPWSDEASETQRLGWRAHCHALAKLKHRCDTLGARLVLFDLGYPIAFSQAIERLADEVGAEYSQAGRHILARAEEGVYLAGDGHWSPLGHAIIADELARLGRIDTDRRMAP